MSRGDAGWGVKLVRRLGLDDLTVGREDLMRISILFLVCIVCSVLVVDFARAPTDNLAVGDPAPRTVKAPFTFQYPDHMAYETARASAADSALPVYVYQADLTVQLQQRIEGAFSAARSRLLELRADAEVDLPLTAAERSSITDAFQEALGVHIPRADAEVLLDAEFSFAAESTAASLLGRSMEDPVVRDREALPRDASGLKLITLKEGETEESTIVDFEGIITPSEARDRALMGTFEYKELPAEVVSSAAKVARALVRPNFNAAPLETEQARADAVDAVQLQFVLVKRGAILFRAGDTLTERHLMVYRELQNQKGDVDVLTRVWSVALLLMLMLGTLFSLGSATLQSFSTRVRDVAAVGVLIVLTSLIARVTIAASDPVAVALGYDAEGRSVWFVVPVAGGAMIVRQLLGVGWTWIFATATSAICGLMMGAQVLPALFFLISAVAAAGIIEEVRDRIGVIRAGLYVGLINAICVLFIHFVLLSVAEGEVSMAVRIRPFWSMSFAFAGGVLSAFLVLGLIPVFEVAGFVTNFRLMELANLNHPLLRELMLRAPGSYHHSVIVGTLAEAGCQSIGADALRAKVASYFHDIGKSIKPQYFVENQRDGINRHDDLQPQRSAQIIISHVTEGAKLAREHGLPKPIVNNILMHHGTGLLQYFFHTAQQAADDPSQVRESDYRYPGPKPNTREAGIIMLADKVEAATRTISHPDEANIRAMISRIISSVIADGQFSQCPLTLQEITAAADTFVQVLMGIYHQRIEYPDTADLSRNDRGEGTTEGNREGTITLEILPTGATDSGNPVADRPIESAFRPMTPSELRQADEEGSDVVDYESLDHLPRGEN